jgi:aspartate ammonia-lyase
MLPQSFNKKVDSLALTKMSTALSSWKTQLKDKIKKGKSWEQISHKDPSLSREDFEAFKSSLETDEAKKWTTWGKKMRELNLGAHHCGSGGYRGKQPTWDKEDAEMIRLGKENPWLKIVDL